MLDKAGETWNKTVIKSTGNSTNKSTITKLPNYMPHVFKGDFRIWINQIDASTGKTKPVAAYSANNKLGVQIVKSRLKKDKPEYFDTSKYQMVIKRIKRLPKLKGVKEILYPGQNKQRRYKKNINKKINIPKNVAEDLKKLNA
jgi:hypothetical protein